MERKDDILMGLDYTTLVIDYKNYKQVID